MANNLFNTLNGGGMMSQLQQLRANPLQFLMNHRLNIPQELQNNPQGIVQYLLNTGQMSQNDFNNLQSRVRQLTN